MTQSERLELFMCAIDGQLTPVLRDQVKAVSTASARRQPWFDELVGQVGASPGRALAVREWAPTAETQTAEQDAAAKREADERRAAAKRRADQHRSRDVRTLRWVIYWNLIVPVPLLVGLYRANTQLELPDGILGSLGPLSDAAPKAMVLGFIAAGAFVGPALVGVTLLARRPFVDRKFGQLAGLVMLMLAVGAYFGGMSYLQGSVDTAQDALRHQPLPMDYVHACQYRSNSPSIWNSKSAASRTFVDASCREVVRYVGIDKSWSVPWSTPINALASIGDTFVAISNEGHSMAVLDDDTGQVLWRKQCPDGQFVLDRSQFDAGDRTPTNQRVVGTCGQEAFNLDPKTGVG